MKKCSKCGVEKEYCQFNKCSRNKDGLHSYCRECHSVHYKNNATRHKNRVAERNNRVIKENREIVLEYLKNGCVDCGEKNIIVLEFDHLDPSNKEFNISHLLRHAYSKEKLIKEIEKCQVCCANCHRMRTEKQRPSWKTQALVTQWTE